MLRRCKATNGTGSPCSAQPVRADGCCYWHSPETAAERAENRRKGGKRRSNVARAEERLPPDLRDLKRLLFGALAKTMKGEMTPAVAQAVGSLSRAIVAVHAAGEYEERLRRLEEQAGEERSA